MRFIGCDPGFDNIMYFSELIQEENGDFLPRNRWKYSRYCDYHMRKYQIFNNMEEQLKQETQYRIDGELLNIKQIESRLSGEINTCDPLEYKAYI